MGDPLDKRYINVGKCGTFENAGEGAFAKEDVPALTIYAIYSGRTFTGQDEFKLMKSQNISEGVWMYRHNVAVCDKKLDIPEEYGSMEKYTGSLGHKVNHKFEPNSDYITFDSARFGMIIALRARIDIAKGEEFFASYGYPISVNLPWYNKLYEEHIKENPVKESQIDLEKLIN